MFSFLFGFSISHILDFQYERIVAGDIIARRVDTLAGIIHLNLSISNCPPNYSVQLYAFEEIRIPYVFPNSTNFQPICCPSKEKCNLGQVYFQENAPVISRMITPEVNNTGKNTTDIDESDIILQQTSEIEITRKGIWTILISNCGSEEIMIHGFATIRRHDGCIDIRLKLLYTISILIIIIGVGMILYHLFMWVSSVPKLSLEQKSIIGLITLFTIYGLLTTYLYFSWNQTGDYKISISYSSSFLRSLITILVYYATLRHLQLPDEIKLYGFFGTIIPAFIGAVIENFGIKNFSSRYNGMWIFGYGHPCIEFLTIVSVHIFVFVYAHLNTPKEDANENRRILLALVFCTILSYTVMNLCLFGYRFNKNLIQTRKSEWVPFTLWPMLISVMISINAWYAGELNPEGWQMFNSGEDNQNAFVIKRGGKNQKNTKNMKAMQNQIKQAKLQKQQQIIQEEKERHHTPPKLMPVQLEQQEEV